MPEKEKENNFLNYKSPSTKLIVSPISKILSNPGSKKEVILKQLQKKLLNEKTNSENKSK